MKKYACHRLYLTPTNTLRMASVTIDGTGRVCAFAELHEETSATEWIGGIILLTPTSELNSRTCFKELLEANLYPSEVILPCYAWHITNFDFTNECLTIQSTVQPLNGNTIITL